MRALLRSRKFSLALIFLALVALPRLLNRPLAAEEVMYTAMVVLACIGGQAVIDHKTNKNDGA